MKRNFTTMATATVTTNKTRSEKWLRTLARRRGLKIERSRLLNRDPERPYWLVARQIGVILRDASLEEVDTFFRLPAEKQQVAIGIAENLEVMFGRCDDADGSYRFDVAQRTQSVVQDILLTGICGDELEPLLGSLRKWVQSEQARRAA
jgi:hypothetical protein